MSDIRPFMRSVSRLSVPRLLPLRRRLLWRLTVITATSDGRCRRWQVALVKDFPTFMDLVSAFSVQAPMKTPHVDLLSQAARRTKVGVKGLWTDVLKIFLHLNSSLRAEHL